MFEVVIWKEGQDPFRQALGLHAPIKETQLNLTLNTNIPRAGFLQSNEKYYWGVLIVHTTPTYQRVALASDPRRFIYKP